MPVAVERTHEVLVELVVVLELEFGADEGEVVVDAVALGREIDPIEVADALGVNQRRDRPPGDAEGPPLDIRPIRVQARVAADVDLALPLRMQSHRDRKRVVQVKSVSVRVVLGGRGTVKEKTSNNK